MLTDFSIEDIDHIEISVKDKGKSVKWYKEILGLEPLKELELWNKNGGPLFIGNKDGSIKIALFNGTKDSDGSINRMAFRTTGDKFINFLNRVDDLGLFSLKEKVTKKQVVDHNLSFSIYFDDPDGNKLELTCYDHENLKSKIKSSRSFN